MMLQERKQNAAETLEYVQEAVDGHVTIRWRHGS